MANLPQINFELTSNLYGIPPEGILQYKYSAFKNLTNSIDGLTDLRITLSTIGLTSLTNTIELDVEPAYDNSANLIFTDKKSFPKLVNSRFSITGKDTYKIADRKGNIDTNLYSQENFQNESALIKQVSKVIGLDFLGIQAGGKMPVGTYNFYFKLADGDDNKTDFIAESGNVVCHIGNVNDPHTIRGGQLTENSEKLILFKLKNLDLAYQYIRVYYTRTTGSGDMETVTTHFIDDKFKITGDTTEIIITGYENHIEIADSEINIKYTSFSSVQTMTKAQNIAFAGGITNNYEVLLQLEKLSLGVIPKINNNQSIGYLDQLYSESINTDEGYEYFNTKNIYYKLGYWPDEYYRFGIVYLLNDFTLSPVFNIRGCNKLSGYTGKVFSSISEISVDENNIININGEIYENAKGVVKIENKTIYQETGIHPLGIEFTFDGITDLKTELSKLTKGFFIVRQKRIPNVLAQGVGIASSSKTKTPLLKAGAGYFVESFLKSQNGIPKLGRNASFLPDQTLVSNNILLCPDASLRTSLYSSLFNSSEFLLESSKYKAPDYFTQDIQNPTLYYFPKYIETASSSSFKSKLTLVTPGIELIGDGTNKFTSKAGNEYVAWKHLDPQFGNIEEIVELDSINTRSINSSDLKIRGEFNTFIGTSSNNIEFGKYYNIYQKGFDANAWKNDFKVRYNDSSAFTPISDRISWNDLNTSVIAYRGDCYINTYAHRMNWNFIDPELPTNTRIVDPYTWFLNYKVKGITTTTNSEGLSTIDSTGANTSSGTTSFTYTKVLPLFTYKSKDIDESKPNWVDSGILTNAKVLVPGDKSFNKYSDLNGLYGAEKINRPDVNAVDLGHWAIFKIFTSVNTAFRDVDFSNPNEEAIHSQKRSFYPLQAPLSSNKLPESNVINKGISKTYGNKYYFELPETPFLQTNFSNRIYYSNPLINSLFENGNRIFEAQNYQDYTMEYGALIKLIEWYGTLIAIMEHGVLLIPVNERALMANTSGENVYINTDNVLPKNPKVLSNSFGSIWPDSVVKTSKYVYGIDTVAKKIWRTNGQTFENISDLVIQKFLNDNINLETGDNIDIVNTKFVKSHYNAFKQDVLFTFKQGNSQWHLCWNELLGKWVTRYTWFPEFSENINNIFYTFANQELHPNASNKLYKHGFAGTESEITNIHPTKWYEDPKTFEFEFVVVGVQGVQKIFDNLKIISNSTEPDSFFYEVVGEGFDWNKDKSIIYGFTTDAQFTTYLQNNLDVKKLPWIFYKPFTGADSFYKDREALGNTFDMSVLRDITIREHNKTKEKLINIYQKGVDIKKYGRLKGNMQYLEDSWDVQIQPIGFKYIYLKDGVKALTNVNEMKIRDKYIKIRVKYNGEQYAIINALKTLFTISYA